MKLLYRTVAFLFCAVAANQAFCQKEYLDEVFEIVEQNSINRDSVDFQKIRNYAYGQLATVKSVQDCYPIVRYILLQLNDHHSFLMEKTQVDAWKSTSQGGARNVTDAFSGRVVNKDIGYISMQGFSSGDSLSLLTYANEFQDLIKSLDNTQLKGWILDIRENTGGNCWPMLAGLGPLLGEGTCGYFVKPDGTKFSWYYNKGSSGSNATDICRVTGAPYVLMKQDRRIAVLTGPRTASSGEVVATAFRGLTHAKSFGLNTAGLSTANANFTLSDGSMIFLATSVYADRLENTYGGKLTPDYLIDFAYGQVGSEDDPVLKHAIAWVYKGTLSRDAK